MIRLNPKDEAAAHKVGLSVIPVRVLYEVAKAFREGLKYGHHNWRDPATRIKVTTYLDAPRRHLDQYQEGEIFDPDAPKGVRIYHIAKAIAGLMILLDCVIRNKVIDDRPPPSDSNWLRDMNRKRK